MGQAKIDVLQLPRPGPAEQLRVNLIGHAQAGRANRMTEAFQAAIDLRRQAAGAVEIAVKNIERRAAAFG